MDFSFIPDSAQLAAIFNQAIGPAFLLGAVAGFISLLMSRPKNVTDQHNRSLEIADAPGRASHTLDVAGLKQRAILLNSATHLALGAGIATTLLLMVTFAAAFLGLKHVFGGPLLFAVANGLLTVSLYKFAQEVKAGLSEISHF
jgi:hypothetical protein